MHVETLKTFCDLAETKSFTVTAKRRGVTQSAVSQLLTCLERDFRARLVERGAGSPAFKLTPQGQAYLEYNREIVRLAGKLKREIRKIKDACSGVIELAACHSIALYQLPSVLRQFQQDYPATAVHVRYGNVDRVYADVLENKADLGLVSFPRKIKGLKSERFHQERLVLVCHPQHPLVSRRAVTFAKLKGQRFVAWREIPWIMFFRTLGMYDRFHYQPLQEFEEVEMVKRAVEVDVGISILPEATVLSEVANKTLAAVSFEKGGYYQPLAVIYREAKSFSSIMEEFIQSLKRLDGI